MANPGQRTAAAPRARPRPEQAKLLAPPERNPMWALRGPDGNIAPGWYLVPLRLFLGVTFVYASLQKLANPDFFHSASPISIHSQLVAATHTSPIHGLLSHLEPVSTLVGVLIALGELAVGVGTLLGLFTRAAAVGGLLLNLMLFLTVSFQASPYFTGSDIVFVFAWTPFILAGAGGAPALDTWLAEERAAAAGRPVDPGPDGRAVARRSVVSVGAVTAVVAGTVAVLGGLAAALGRAIGGTSPAPSANMLPSAPHSSGSLGSSGSSGSSGSGGSGTPKGTAVGPASSVPLGGSAGFTDPKTGDPSIVIQQTAGKFVAFDAICPHAGCTVAYQPGSRIIACPCHGSEFDPKNGNVVRGPAPYGLTSIPISQGPNGDLYVPS